MYVSIYVCEPVQAFSPLEPERLVRSGREIFVRRAETTLRRWCQLQTNQLQVARDTWKRANPSKKALAKGAGQANGRNWLKLGELNPLGVTDSVACAARAAVT